MGIGCLSTAAAVVGFVRWDRKRAAEARVEGCRCMLWIDGGRESRLVTEDGLIVVSCCLSGMIQPKPSYMYEYHEQKQY